MITFTIYLSNKLTFSLMPLIHILSLLTTAYLFKACDLATQFMQSIKFKPINKHQGFKPKKCFKNQTTVHSSKP